MGIQAVGSGGSLNQISTATRTFYSKQLLATLFQWLAVVTFGIPKDIPPQAGQTISWRQPGKLSAATTALTEGSPPSGSNLSIPEVTATVAQYGDFVEFTDKLVDTGPDPYRDSINMLQAQQVALTFDTLAITALTAGTNVNYPTGASARNQVSSSMPPTTSQFDKAIKNLQNRHVPYVTTFIQPNGGIGTLPGLPAYVAFVTPTMWATIKTLTGVVTVDKYQAGNSTFKNEVGRYDVLRFIMTTNGMVAAGAGASSVDVQLMPIIGQSGLAFSRITGKEVTRLERQTDVPDSSDKLGQKGHIGWKAYFVAKIVDQDQVERCEFYAA